MSEMIINRRWYASFLAGGMSLEFKGTCTLSDLEWAAEIIQLAMKQIRRDYIEPQREPGADEGGKEKA